MSFTRQFYVDEHLDLPKYLGKSEEKLRFVHGEAHEPQSYAMWCPKCCQIWARMWVPESTQDWRIIGGYCEQHPGPSIYVVHGSLMLNWEPELTAILPDDVIRREFDLHMRLWDREMANAEVG